MNFRRVLPLFAIVSVCALVIWVKPSAGDSPKPDSISLTPAVSPAMPIGAIKIGIANPNRIFAGLRETAVVQARLDAEKNNIKATSDAKKAQLENDLKLLQSLYKPGTDQYNEENRKLLEKEIQLDVFLRVSTANLERSGKGQMKAIYDKITDAVKQIAKERGLNLVITDQRNDQPFDVNQYSMDQLKNWISSRNILFSDDNLDITEEIVTRLNQQFKP